MQPCSREMQAMNSSLNQSHISLQDLRNGQIPTNQIHHFDHHPTPSHDDFLDQMLSIPSVSWPDLAGSNPKSLWDISSNTLVEIGNNKSASPDDLPPSNPESVLHHPFLFDGDQSADLASKLRQQQIGGGSGSGGGASLTKSLLLQQQLLLQSRGGGLRSPTGGSGGDSGLLSMPLRLGGTDGLVDITSFKSSNPGSDMESLYNGLAGSQNFHNPQNYGGAATMMNPAQAASASASGAPTQPRQRVRARRGQATDPHSIAERLRRERIAERMKALQELVPNANKTDKASMLDEIIDYVKFLQLQVKVLSMSRLGGGAAATVAPPVADMSSEGGGDCIRASGLGGRAVNGTQTASTSNNSESMTVTEQQVAKLMEEDMGSAMQYLQGKGLCLMPISLATAISTATCHSRNLLSAHNHPLAVSGGPPSPNMSVLTVQSATMGNDGADAVKDAASDSKP